MVVCLTVIINVQDEKEEEKVTEEVKPEDDPNYWRRILGSAYEEHMVQKMKEEEMIMASLGKGKRVRKQVQRRECHG